MRASSRRRRGLGFLGDFTPLQGTAVGLLTEGLFARISVGFPWLPFGTSVAKSLCLTEGK